MENSRKPIRGEEGMPRNTQAKPIKNRQASEKNHIVREAVYKLGVRQNYDGPSGRRLVLLGL